MEELVSPRERTLGTVILILGILTWFILIFGTFGMALVGLAVGFILYLFAQSALISHVKGNGVELSPGQFPDLHAQFSDCCQRLQIDVPPQVYILNGNGALNAFATKFLGTQYVVLMSDIVDAMAEHVDGVRFYIGHELGHLKRKHIHFGHLVRWPVLWLPLLGAAYSRSKETTCDRHGRACSSSGEDAARALAALASGSVRWKNLDVKAYLGQTRQSSGFWMSFHELIAGYPWLTKRAARVFDTNAQLPRRNGLAYLLAIFVPFAGRLGAGFGVLVLVYIIGVLAAIAVPQYQVYTMKAKLAGIVVETQPARLALSNYYASNQKIPSSLQELALNPQLSSGGHMMLNPTNMVLTVSLQQGDLVFVPSPDEQGQVVWSCRNGHGIIPEHLPPNCQQMGK